MDNDMLLYLRPGDRVIVPKSELGLVQHHGIYIGRDHHARHWFLENNWKNGVRYILAKEFLPDLPSSKIRVEAFEGDEAQRASALARAKSKIGASYNLLFYNCEHYSEEVQSGKAKSMQVLIALVMAMVAYFLLRIITKANNNS